jgi:hypothetical protein
MNSRVASSGRRRPQPSIIVRIGKTDNKFGPMVVTQFEFSRRMKKARLVRAYWPEGTLLPN